MKVEARAVWPGGGVHLLVAVLSVVSFATAYAVLTNQTPYCYTLREYKDGRVDYREFGSSTQAFAYENAQGFWSRDPAVVNEESGCSSDKVYIWEGTAAAGFALLGLAAPLRLARRTQTSLGGAFLKTLLGIGVLFSLFDLVGYGAFVAPLMIPLLWFAARGSTPWMRGVWIFFAGICSWILGMWGASNWFRYDSWEHLIFPFIVSGFFSVLFIATTSSNDPVVPESGTSYPVADI